VPASEDKALTEITRRARKSVDFYKELGNAIFLPNLDAMAGVWNGPYYELTVTLEGNHFTALGSYELTGNALAGFGLAPPPPDRVTIEYNGTIKGRSIRGSFAMKRLNTPPPTLLSSSAADKTIPFQIVVHDSGTKLTVMEGEGNTRLIYVWTVKGSM
jgi:hypothetical protein